MKKKYLFFGLWMFLGAFLIADRVVWASVAQWREDQAANLWLGYTQSLGKIPVGLISSQLLPNPNGMLVLGFFLSRLPNLWWVSALLGCVQGALVLWLCWRLFPQPGPEFFLAALPLLTSISLRATSVEFWNQWVMTLPNLLFFIWINDYLVNPKFWKIPLWVALLCFIPSIYLAGIVNALAMGFLGVMAIFARPPLNWKINWWQAALLSLAVFAASLGLTWIPYFHEVAPQAFLNLKIEPALSIFQKLRLTAEAFLNFPVYATFQWSDINLFSILQFDERIISLPAYFLILVSCWLYLVQALCAFGFLLVGLIRSWSKPLGSLPFAANLNPEVARPVGLSFAFIVLCYALSPLLGGPAWVRDQRPDQLIQFLPFFLLFSFLAPYTFRLSPELERQRSKISTVLMGFFALASILGGLFVVVSQHNYRGQILSGADVPLTQKMQVVDLIVTDWKARSNSTEIPVDYQLGGGNWDGISAFGQQLEIWYPAPMTLGRSFDFDLLRRYGLRNVQEGLQLRTFGRGRYLINYAFESQPAVKGAKSVHYYLLGRFRVTMIDW